MTYNTCVCGHDWSKHLDYDKIHWCIYNQSICDCWEFEPLKLDKREIFNLNLITKK